ncbi:MAG: hypothetical protein ACTSQA_03010 [Candidatus Heimdallarchaeaceae archaeon]
MTYSTFINKLRVELKDFGQFHRDRWDGDGSTTVFAVNHIPIKDGSYTFKVGGTAQTETTHFSIDKDVGEITAVSAPANGSDNVELTYKSLKIRDEDYLDIINDAIDRWRWKFWKMDIDEDTITTVKDQYEYDLSGITNILYVLKLWYKSSSGATVWNEVSGYTNYKYYTALQKLHTNPPFATTSLPIKILYLRSLTKGTALSDTLDISDEWLLPVKYYIYARYYERLISEKVDETAAVTTMPSYTPSQVMFQLAESYYKKADEIVSKIAPRLPNMAIKTIHDGIIM